MLSNSLKRLLAITMALSLLIEIFAPSIVWAVTGGPSSPEFSDFESVNASGMVNEYSGAFGYTIPVLEVPGPDGGNYALSLSYHSGSSPNDEGSWVGYGWTLNPGAITRTKRGFPDDVKDGSVTYYTKQPANVTGQVSFTLGGGTEIFGVDLDFGLENTLMYNNYAGFSYLATPFVGFKYGMCNLMIGFQEDDGASFDFSVSPMEHYTQSQGQSESNETDATLKRSMSPGVKRALSVAKYAGQYGKAYGQYKWGNVSIPTNTTKYTGFSTNVSVSFHGTVLPLPAGISVGSLGGGFSLQTTDDAETLTYQGYMYSQEAAEEDMMDYHVEKEAPYNLRDYNLQIPYSSKDVFSVSGEGVGGGFIVHSKKIGSFHPNYKKSETTIANVAVEVMAGLDVDAGVDIGGGYHYMEVGKWDDEGANANYAFTDESDEPYFFRFNGDLASEVSFGNSDPQQSSLTAGSTVPGLKTYTPKSPSSLYSEMNNDESSRINRTSYIGYHTNTEMLSTDNDGNYYKRYTRDENSSLYINRDDDAIENGIGEFTIYNQSGVKYVYGLPVYARNEKNISYGVNEAKGSYIVHQSVSSTTKEQGEEMSTPYASTFLLTEITTTDYIDRSMNGPTDDDFGGYVKFKYKQAYGSDNTETKSEGDWFHWRIPYTGLLYNPGELSDSKDDVGTLVSGDKEVYYLDTIETKTHMVLFYTSKRKDGYEAADDETAASTSTAMGADQLERLDSIELYVKDVYGNPAELMKKIHFEYNYSLMDGVPNSKNGSSKTGRLTLTRVWFEYGGVASAKISPYEFYYEYPTNAEVTYPNTYNDLSNYGTGLNENPDYNDMNVDRWGAYCADGESRHALMKPWVNQNPDANFDPAAWQLKRIVLPTRGELHVQYEQNTYSYVQNRNAMAMVNLKASTGDVLGHPLEKFYLDIDSLGISAGSTESNELVNLIRKQFVEDGEKIYFKFLYGLSPAAEAGLDRCDAEYVSGYMNVVNVAEDVNGVYIEMGLSQDEIQDLIGSFSASDMTDVASSAVDMLFQESYSFPRQVCLDFYEKKRNGVIDFAGLCSVSESLSEGSDPLDAVYVLLAKIGDAATIFDKADVCLSVDEANSYLRVPMPTAKKGGGIRVKRVLVYDPGIEANDEALYGHEYVYQTLEGESSGVASNEPSEGREENALVQYIQKRDESDVMERIIAGKDREQFEGPFGEDFLSSPFVGYSRVVIKNIHDGETHDGFSVKEFFTTYDYPYDAYYPTLDAYGFEQTDISQEKDWLPIYAILVNLLTSKVWLSQGYSFISYDIDGRPKSEATYGGDYDDINNPDKIQLNSKVEYSYYEPGETMQYITADNSIVEKELPKEMEVARESRKTEDVAIDGKIQFDVSVGFLGPIPLPCTTPIPYFNYTESKLFLDITTKTTRYPAVIKSIKSYKDGIYSVTDNVNFDTYSGNPSVTQTADGFNGLLLGTSSASHQGNYFSRNFLAPLYYNNAGLKSIGEQYVLEDGAEGIDIAREYDGSNFYLHFSGGNVCDALDKFAEGDLLAVYNESGVTEIFHAGELDGSTLAIYPTANFYENAAANYADVDVEILVSGRSNSLDESIGNLVTYGSDPVYTHYSLADIDPVMWEARNKVADQLTSLLNASAGSGTISLSSTEVQVEDGAGNCSDLDLKIDVATSISYYTSYHYDTIVDCDYVKGVIDTNYINCDTSITCYTYTPLAGQTVTICDTAIQCQEQYVSGMIQVCDTTVALITDKVQKKTITLEIDNCQIEITQGGHFDIDEETGELVYYEPGNDCYPVTVDCIDFCPSVYPYTTVRNVINANAASLDDDWTIDNSSLASLYTAGVTFSNDYEIGAEGKLRLETNFEYNTTISDYTSKIYAAGIMDSFVLFNWKYLQANNDTFWLSKDSVQRYSPNGNVLKQIDDMGVESVVKYGYGMVLPYLIANNADYNEVLFESFENAYENPMAFSLVGEDGYYISMIDGNYGELVEDTAHSGNYSYRISHALQKTVTISKGGGGLGLVVKYAGGQVALKEMTLSNQLMNYGLSVRFWAKSTATSTTDSYELNWTTDSVDFSKIAQTGEWTLYEATITDWGTLTKGDVFTPKINYYNSSQSVDCWIDDLRVQPLNTQMTTYVYDASTLRLITVFDDQHFGLFYQYNSEGKLVRKQIETTKGFKTVEETQYHIPTVTRN